MEYKYIFSLVRHKAESVLQSVKIKLSKKIISLLVEYDSHSSRICALCLVLWKENQRCLVFEVDGIWNRTGMSCYSSCREESEKLDEDEFWNEFYGERDKEKKKKEREAWVITQRIKKEGGLQGRKRKSWRKWQRREREIERERERER